VHAPAVVPSVEQARDVADHDASRPEVDVHDHVRDHRNQVLAGRVRHSYRLIAPKRLAAQIE
jgi:hypothetical protein